MNEIVSIDLEKDILVVKHHYKNEWSEMFEYKLSEVVNNIPPYIKHKKINSKNGN